MNKVKQTALAVTAISVLGVASISLASGCPTSISPATATCLSNTADQTFQTNYQNDYLKQSGGSVGSTYQSQNNMGNSYYTSPNNTQATPSYSNSNNKALQKNDNNNNNTTKSGIRWF